MQEVQTLLPVGSIVNERYQVEALLGKGGFGAVYLVRDLRVRQNVFALKEIIDPNQSERRHFTFEAEVLKRTDHPALPRVYRAFDVPEQGRAYMLMDYIEGSNLEKLRLKQPERRFALPAVLALLAPIVDALSYLHTQQPPIIHRDIKPSNIIVPDSGEGAVLVDFGIAKEMDQDATTTVIRHATPGYGAPEQYGTGTDTRTDVYGLGATLYTLLTGSVPTDAFFRMAQQMSKRADPLPPVTHFVPSLPAAVAQAIARAMAPAKNERFATVADFWAALQAGAQSAPNALAAPEVRVVAEPALARHIRSGSAASNRQRRVKWPVLALLLLLALGLGFAAAFLTLPHLRPQQTNSPTARPTAAITRAAGTTPTPTAITTPTPTPRATATPTPPATATPAPSYPALHSTYSGTLVDYNGTITTDMALRQVTQQGGRIQGNFQVKPPLSGNGPFTGTVTTKAYIQFTVHSSDPSATQPLFFYGTVQSNGSISGEYCSLNNLNQCDHSVGGYGTWSVQPVSSGS